MSTETVNIEDAEDVGPPAAESAGDAPEAVAEPTRTSANEFLPAEGTDSEASASSSATDDDGVLTSQEINSLLSHFGDDDDLAESPSENLPESASDDSADPATEEIAPDAPAAKASCPSGGPKPAINMSALSKARTGGKAATARLFGENPPVEDAPDDAPEEYAPRSIRAPEKRENRFAKYGEVLDAATKRVRKVHAMLPIACGGLGLVMLVNGSLILLLSLAGWI